MLVKATNTMLKAIAAAIPEYNFRLVKFTLHEFRLFVNIDDWRHENDYNPATGKMQVIKVIYPGDYYSIPRYITTNDLLDAFRRSDKTMTGFLQAVKDEIEI